MRQGSRRPRRKTGSTCAPSWKPAVSIRTTASGGITPRSEEHTSELQSRQYLVCRLLLEKKNNIRAACRLLSCRPPSRTVHCALLMHFCHSCLSPSFSLAPRTSLLLFLLHCVPRQLRACH